MTQKFKTLLKNTKCCGNILCNLKNIVEIDYEDR